MNHTAAPTIAPPARRLFGTDGIRGKANVAPMDASTALRLGQAAGTFFNRGSHRHRVVIGKDTRLSGYLMEAALAAGFIGAGMDVVLLGPLPTPAVALLTRSMRADLGVMISASHNPYEDNGIKLFGPDGLKLSDAQEAEIEALMAGDLTAAMVPPSKLGRASRMDDSAGRYIEAVKSAVPRGLTLEGLRIVVDCAHGAAYKVAPTVLWELGAEVVSIGVAPDGFNINKGVGSTAPAQLAALVKERRADLGIALDGDADRLVLVDEEGTVIDGDQILALIASSWHARGALRGGEVVATVMSNMGLERFLRQRGLGLLRTPVGDRYVGDWVAGKKHGQGELQYANGDVFRGEWNDDHASGRGLLQYANGNVYEGGWLMDRRHGFGIFTCAADGYRYEGDWYQGRRHGTGTIFLPNGDAFSGTFKEGRTAGPVEYRFAEDSPWANADL